MNDKPSRDDGPWRVVSSFAGTLAVVVGGAMLVTSCAFASLGVDPDRPGGTRWGEVVGNMIADRSGAVAYGLALIGVGLWVALTKPKSHG